MDPTPRDSRIVHNVVLILLLVAVAILGILLWRFDRNHTLDAAGRLLIAQLDAAIVSYQVDFGAYPPDDGFESLRRPIRERHGEPPPPPPVEIRSPSGKLIHYRCPGAHNPTRFDLWTEDSRGNSTGINNW